MYADLYDTVDDLDSELGKKNIISAQKEKAAESIDHRRQHVTTMYFNLFSLEINLKNGCV